jgi:transposase-like protein
MVCLHCGATASVKNGFMKGIQRYKCKVCGYQFTQETPRGKPFKDKILALTLYLSGLSMNMIAKLIGVSTQSVMRWIKQFYHQYAEIPMQEGIVEEIEIDEMYHFIGKKTASLDMENTWSFIQKTSWMAMR